MKKFNLKKSLGLISLVIVVMVAVLLSALFCMPQKSVLQTEAAEESYNVTSLTETELTDLVSYSESLEETFNLRTTNPILTENQTTSNFCWSYASLKALESAFMVQHNEYHNFSDVGMAYAYFYDQMEKYKGDPSNNIPASLNASGNFYKLNKAIENYGLIYEGEFSNSKYEDITDSNYLNYEYLLDFADKSITSRIRPVSLSGVSKDVLKAFIKKYGAVFAGIEKGTVFTDGKLYYPGVEDSDSSQMYISGNHAVCLIGWDDSTNTFRALNSWGVADSTSWGMKTHEEFNIPDTYTTLYYNIYGYIIEEESNVVTKTTTASDFAQTIKVRETPLINLFTYPETVEISYQLNERHNFENIHTKIFKGYEDVTHCFTISYDDPNRIVKVKERDFGNVFEGGTYIVRFYEDVNVVGTKEIIIYSGTELSYVELYKFVKVQEGASEIPVDDAYNLMNTIACREDTATYYISANDTYYMQFYFTDIFKVGTGFSFNSVVADRITTARAYTYDGDSFSEVSIPAFTVTQKQQYGKFFEITLSGLSSYVGQMIEFEVYINSTMYSAVTKTYHFQLFLSGDAQVTSPDAYKIEYVLNGGANSSCDPATLLDVRNIERYPNFVREENSGNNMTSFELVAPTKTNSIFLGWFTDPDFDPDSRIYVIDASIASDIVLYAKWLPVESSLFSLNLTMTKVTEYQGSEKTIDENLKLIYGDKIDFESVFQIDPSIAGLFSAKFYFVVNGVEFSEQDLFDNATLNLSINHNELVAGDYVVKAVVSMVISHMEQGLVESKLEFLVNKKELQVDYDNVHSKVVYDGSYHEPIVTLFGKYDFDEELEFEWDKELQKNAGSYDFYMTNLSNQNYYVDLSQKYVLVIDKKEVSLLWSNLTTTYNANVQRPVCVVKSDDLVDGDYLQVLFNLNNLVNANEYTMIADLSMNPNYKAKKSDEQRIFVIKPASLILTFKPIVERVQTAPANRKQITESSYTIAGTLYGTDDLHITTYSEGLTSHTSGVFPVTASYKNNNYAVIVKNGTYTLTGYYYVDYVLPNGEIYRELVEDGEDPKGVNRDIYDIPALHGYTYSEKLKNNGEDRTITVSVKNYSWVLYTSIVVLAVGVIYWFMTRDARRNKVS